MDTNNPKSMPTSEEYWSCEEKKKKRLVAIKLEGSDGREAEVMQFYEINENEHVGIQREQMNI